MKWLKAWSCRLAALGGGVLLAELVLLAAGLASPRIAYRLSPPWSRVLVPDAKLGFRMSPYLPGNDALGFRNPAVPEKCEILAVGQSSTYGFAAMAEEAWPRQLARLTGKSVYNMSCGGYGPCELSVLLDRGLVFSPRIVLMEVFPANDFLDAYRAVYEQHRFAELASDDATVLKELERADAEATLEQLAGRAWPKQLREVRTPTSPLRQWVSQHSSLYGLAREIFQLYQGSQYTSFLREDGAKRNSFTAGKARAGLLAFEPDGERRTVFYPPAYEALAYDLHDPRIREGQRITESILQSMQEKLSAKGIRFVVVSIPSKAAVYKDLAAKAEARLPEAYYKAVEKEEDATDRLRKFCESRRVEWIDGTPALRAELARGQRLHPEGDDQHLNGAGYGMLARAIVEYLEPGGAAAMP